MFIIKKGHKYTLIMFFLLFVILFQTASASGMRIKTYEVYINDEYVGSVDTREEAEEAYKDAKIMQFEKRGMFEVIGLSMNIVEKNPSFDEVINREELTAAIYGKMEEYMSEKTSMGYRFTINDKSWVLESPEAVEEVINEITSDYDEGDEFEATLVKNNKEDSFIVEFDRKEDTEEVMATKKSSGGAFDAGTVSYTASKAKITDMCINDDIIICETYALNEDITSSSQVVSDIMNNEELSISVSVVSEYTSEEEFYSEPQYISDETMYKGESCIIREASPGIKEVTIKETRENGEQTSVEVVDETVLSMPEPAIIKQGEKPLPDYIMPVTGAVKTSDFGERWGRLHKGVDLGVVSGTEVVAARSGTVTRAGWNGSYGYLVTIDHGDGIETRYAHLSEIKTSVGENVSQGEVIALSGNTGRSTGPHLHFEIRINGEPVNPEDYLSETLE